MTKNNKDKKNTGLSLFNAIALLLALIAIILCCCFIRLSNVDNNSTTSPAIVLTTDLSKEQEVDTRDLIADFILDHEYFAADDDALNFDIENIDKEIDEIEKLIELSEKEARKAKEQVINTEAEETPSVEVETDVPLISVVIDDMGINKRRTLDIISIKAPLTSSFLTYGRDLAKMAQMAKDSGHEIMIHAPMEPKVSANLAPDTLKTDMDKAEVEKVFKQMLDKFENIEVGGINNHMGSKFTEDKERLGFVMSMLKNRNMFFLDSKTTAVSKGKELAQEQEVAFAQRDVFLDNENDYDYILKQLEKTEKIALKKGYAIAICHPKSQTFPALKDWVVSLKDKNIKLVHVSDIVKKVNKEK